MTSATVAYQRGASGTYVLDSKSGRVLAGPFWSVAAAINESARLAEHDIKWASGQLIVKTVRGAA